MTSIRRILFAVRDPAARRQPGVDKAIGIAKSLGATLELFHALSSPVFIDLLPMAGEPLEKLHDRALARARDRLAKFVATARRRGVPLDYSVEWDYPPHEAVVRRAAKIGADLVIAECHKGPRSRAWLMHLTDWELLRTCPLPVLLLKNARPYRRPAVLAAIDPAHVHAKPLDLDTRIVASARQVAEKLRGALHVMHANHPAVSALALGDVAFGAADLALTYEQLQQQARAQFDQFIEREKLPRKRAHLVDAAPDVAIPRSARRLGAQLVVMGAVSRSGLKRVFIGNTAEEILTSLPCDVLVVKPEGFETHVAREPRGMRVVAPQPLAPMPA